MPCLNLSTNIRLEDVDTSGILSEATKTIADIVGKPESVRPRSLTLSTRSLFFDLVVIFYTVHTLERNEEEALVLIDSEYLLINQYVMVVLKGSIPILFGGTQQPAAYGELVSIGGLNPDANQAQEHAQCLHALHQQ
ncbi:hypothetical protein ZIOFF_043268 [Zingiber officinale]|uniref:Uncharacterized protein n=1 Tax=Zingiber officinale TaxID=94328 RepID=A0A8J5KTW5_ZINOF|nr:hypothetical protein ZIOFF_043268 [Zingiber officinale]